MKGRVAAASTVSAARGLCVRAPLRYRIKVDPPSAPLGGGVPVCTNIVPAERRPSAGLCSASARRSCYSDPSKTLYPLRHCFFASLPKGPGMAREANALLNSTNG
ncbi:hypothetical protein SUGI_1180120 [Cryptomeria japonica]|nr:hypothetical protein SUGI_1180120 [Cryptomeria japonica]